MNSLRLSKLDVAKRELEHALKLFFNNGDFVITHLVISACEDILEGIGSDKLNIRMELKKRIKKDKQAYVMGKIKHAYNFFKHSSRDSKELLEFNPESSEFFILDAIEMYQSITGEVTGLMMAFRAWFYLKYHNLLLDAEQKLAVADISEKVNINDKSLFLKAAEQYETKRSGV